MIELVIIKVQADPWHIDWPLQGSYTVLINHISFLGFNSREANYDIDTTQFKKQSSLFCFYSCKAEKNPKAVE